MKEVRTYLRRVEPALLPELREEFKLVGAKVAADAKRRIPVGRATWDKHPGQARDSIRVTAGGNTIYIVGGKAKVPYYGWLDFGGVLLPTGQRKMRTAYRQWDTGFKYRVIGQATGKGRTNRMSRPFIKKGRAIYPAIDENAVHIMKGALGALDAALAKSGFSGN